MDAKLVAVFEYSLFHTGRYGYRPCQLPDGTQAKVIQDTVLRLAQKAVVKTIDNNLLPEVPAHSNFFQILGVDLIEQLFYN
jgi:hypothetical protein